MSNDHENTVSILKHHRDFKIPRLRFHVSSRQIRPHMDMSRYLKLFFMYIDIGQIESVFGNPAMPSRLYGGRMYKPENAMSDKHMNMLRDLNISISLTLTNHFYDDEGYRESKAMLRKYHHPSNSIICTNNRLVRRIREDFPDYKLKASIIKNLNTIEKIEQSLNLYDQVVLPMDKNNDDELLRAIQQKDRVILFANATCAYKCPLRTCYLGFSQRISNKKQTVGCSQQTKKSLYSSSVFFDVNTLSQMGFKHFKLVPIVPRSIRNVIHYLQPPKNHGARQCSQYSAS